MFCCLTHTASQRNGSHFPSQVTPHTETPDLPETAQDYTPFLRSSPGRIIISTHRPQAFWGQPQTPTGVLGTTAAKPELSALVFDVLAETSKHHNARQNCLHHHIPSTTPCATKKKKQRSSRNRTINYQPFVENSSLKSWIRRHQRRDEKDLH